MEINVVPSPERPTYVPRSQPMAKQDHKADDPTADELKKRTFEAMGWSDPEKPTPEQTTVPAPVQTVPQPPTAPAAPAPAAPAPVRIPSNDDLIVKTATAVATSVVREMNRTATQPHPTEELEMLDDDKEDLEAARFIERTEPGHKGLGDRFEQWLQAFYEYQDDWLEKNPDKEFDPEADEHDAWYEANPQPIDRKALDKAKIKMAVDAGVEERYQREIKPKVEKVTAQQTWDQVKEAVFTAANAKILEMVTLAHPEIAKLVTGPDGLASFTEENCEAADKLDPIAYEAVNVAAKRLWPMIVELEKTVIDDLKIKLTRSNEIHAAIIDAQEEEEQRILASPNERNAGGLRFVTVPDFNRMTPAERSNCRCLTVDDMEALLVKNFAEQAKKTFERLDSLGKRKYSSAPQPAAGRQTPEQTPVIQAQPVTRKPQSPSISSASDVVTTRTTVETPRKSFGEAAVQEHFGR